MILMNFFNFFLGLTSLGPALMGDEPVVNISSGPVRGYRAVSTGGMSYFGFRAIPYANPPIGNLRFKPPEPFDRWHGVLDGTEMGEECPQFEEFSRGTIGNEDCLTINVYTPKLEKNAQLPVMVWIHGGGFIIGSGIHSHYGPQNLMDYPIVLVTFNYRLGVLGFLNTNDGHSYGNYGMLDQVLALKWVQRNIGHFGGSSNKVTIFGESAGSASVTYHLLSNLSKGLFQRAIAQSGSAINYWGLQRNPLQVAQRLAQRVNCPFNVTQQLVKCLRLKPVHDLIHQSRQLYLSFMLPNTWGPSMEVPGGSGFITEDPVKMLEEGTIANKVPTIIGLSKSEGDFFYLDLSSEFPTVTGRQRFQNDIPSNLHLFTSVRSNMTNKLVQAIASNYYADVDFDDHQALQQVFSRIMGDSMFAAGISKTAELLSKAGIPTYTYMFKYLGKHCLAKYIRRQCGNFATHADELFLQFRFIFAQVEPMTKNDARMASILNGLWVAFAQHRNLTLGGDKDLVWPKYDHNRSYVELNLRSVIKNGLLSEKMDFWNNIN